MDSKKTKDEIKDIQKKVTIKEISDNENTVIVESDNIKVDDPYWDFIKVNLLDVDFNKLLSTNNETKGWINVKGTNINYPFVQTNNNDYYLHHTFDKSYNDAGWVFADYRNNIEKIDRNTILYAHGRLDNTMFGSLRNILKNEWINNTDNYIIRLSTPYENTLWQVFSVYRIKTTNDYIQTTFKDDIEYQNFLNMLINRSKYDFKTSINSNDYIITLSTCFDDYEKVVLHAKLIKKETKN